ncbi:18248_t:CDS:1, partial [Funneliformis geosporum]
ESTNLIDLLSPKIYRKIKDNLRIYGLIFAEQLISSCENYLYTFNDINVYQKMATDMFPRWFKTLEDSIITDTINRKLTLPIPQHFLNISEYSSTK